MLHHLYRTFTISLLLLWSSTSLSWAQYNRLFTTDNELPNSLINQVIETPDENIWIATEDGLCRFNGSTITTYRHNDADSCSLVDNFIRTICCDDKGHLLVGTILGVQMYNPRTDNFSPAIVNPELGIIPNSNCIRISLLSNGDFLAIGTFTFTIHIDENDKPHAIANSFTGTYTMAHCGLEDKEGNIWISKLDGLLYRQTPNGEIQTMTPSISTNYLALCMGPDGNMYASGEFGGLYRYNKERDDMDELVPAKGSFVIRDFAVDDENNQIYLGTDGNGVKVLDCKTGTVSPLVFDDLHLDVSKLKAHSVHKSRNGDIWLGLYQKGVYVMSRTPLSFHYFGPKSIRYNCIGQNCVTSMIRANDGNIWVATDNGGIYAINDQGKTLAYYHCGTQPDDVPLALLNLFEDSRHRVWYASYRQGGGMLNLKTGRCKNIPIANESMERGNIYAYTEDKRGQIWVASLGRGVMKYDELKRQFRPVPLNIPTIWSCSMLYDENKDRLYVGTYTGLCTVDLTLGDSVVNHNLDAYLIFSMTKCSDSELALCTNQGLVIYNCETEEHKLYTTADGLPGNIAYAAQTDGDGNLWVSGNAGLSKMNIRQKTFSNYTAQEGLQGNEFYKNASMRDKDGTLWFGGANGITWFDPHDIHSSTQTVNSRIVSLKSDQNNIIPGENLVYSLSEDEHSFTIELATLPIMLTRRVQYRYSMDEDPWMTLPPMLNRVSFSHLNAGEHTFRFQAVSDGVDSEISEAKINIAYPWYRSTMASITWCSLLLCCFFLLYLLLLRRHQAMLMKRDHQQEVAINEAKLEFFMNIAHEFRTPMTLIVSPLHKLMSADKDPVHQRSFQIMDRNANRILGLTNQLMDLRKIDKGQMRLFCQYIDVESRIREVFENFTDLAEIRKIKMSMENHLPANLKAWIDPDILDKVTTNLLSNAIKYTPEDGSITLSIQKEDSTQDFPEGCISIQVKDTGIGINAKDKLRIFERFYRIRHSGTQAIGTGIGLNLVHALVALHHGSIEVTDNPIGHGTCFSVHFPLGENIYSAEEKISNTTEKSENLYSEINTASIALSSLNEGASYSPEEKATQTKYRILLVDDDDEVRRYLEQELSVLYKVVTATNGEEALNRLLQEENIDLILSDVMMPMMDGKELCQKVRQNVRLNHLPIILLTAKASDEDNLESLKIGANAFIAKPFNIEILMKTVQNLLESQVRLRNSFSGQQLPTEQISTPELQSPDERLLQKILKVINDNLGNSDLTTDFIAHEVGLSRVHLYRKLKELTNQSARNYIRNIRLAKAAELLSQKKMSVAEVAYMTGFSNPNNFSTAFHDLYGMSPKEYMEKENLDKK